MAVGDVYRLVRKVVVDGEAHYNVLHFEDQTSADDREQELADTWNGTLPAPGVEGPFVEAMEGAQSYTKIGLSITRIFPTLGDSQDFPLLDNSPNLEAGLPTFAAIVHNIKTGFGSRSKRGKFYVGGIPEALTQGNVASAALMSKHDLINAILLRDFDSNSPDFSGFQIGVWSKLLNEFTAATSISTTATIATLRRRKAGRGI